MARLLRDTDVMADVLAFLPRKVIALQLASVNVAFSALCNCWCISQEDEDNAASVCDASASAVPASSAYHGSKSKKVWFRFMI